MSEAVIIDVVRTPIGRRNGALSGIHPIDLLGMTIKELLRRTGVDAALIEDHFCGCASKVGEQGYNTGRNAGLAAGLPDCISGTTIDRQCASSMQTLQFAAAVIDAGVNDLVIASGIENMSRVPADSDVEGKDPFGPVMTARTEGKLTNVGVSAELVAHKFSISREQQDDFGYRSHVRAAEAYRAGKHLGHILPIEVVPEEGEPYMLDRDEGVRLEPDREKMKNLQPAFYEEHWDEVFPGQLDWTVTAGNSSQISDGAVAMLIASPKKAAELGLRGRARIVAQAAVGCDPVIQLIAPIPATEQVLAKSGLGLKEMSVVEVNEAFASVVLAWKKEFCIDDEWFDEHVNPNGGAIAIGHPLGASGGRILSDLLADLQRRDARYGMQVMCAFHGMANAFIIERL